MVNSTELEGQTFATVISMEQTFATTICNFHYKHLTRSIIEAAAAHTSACACNVQYMEYNIVMMFWIACNIIMMFWIRISGF